MGRARRVGDILIVLSAVEVEVEGWVPLGAFCLVGRGIVGFLEKCEEFEEARCRVDSCVKSFNC